MRLAIIKLGEDETVFYNLGIFSKEEDIIIFPYKEFQEFYDEVKTHLNIIMTHIKECFDVNSNITPEYAINIIKDYTDLIQKDMDSLMKFEIQTTLEVFQKQHTIKPKKLKEEHNEFELHKKGLQSLIGL